MSQEELKRSGTRAGQMRCDILQFQIGWQSLFAIGYLHLKPAISNTLQEPHESTKLCKPILIESCCNSSATPEERHFMSGGLNRGNEAFTGEIP